MTKQNNGEAETRKSLANGHGITFPNAEEAIKWLKRRCQDCQFYLVLNDHHIIDGKPYQTCSRGDHPDYCSQI